MNSIYIILVSVSPVLYMLCMSSEDSWMIQFQLNLFTYSDQIMHEQSLF